MQQSRRFMSGLTSIQRLFAIAVAGLAITACGFGDDRNHAADDVPDPVCGDGFIDPGEECDDDGTDDGDGCDGDCEVELGWSCIGEPSACTEGVGECGDGAIANGEDCDDDDTANGDGCSADCEVEAGWECQGSPSTCNLLCGNGHVDPGEECDGGPDCDVTCHDIVTTSCVLIPQSGCDANQACDIADAAGNGACRAVTANGTADSSCAAADTACAAGYTCVGQSDTIDTCSKMCHVDAQCSGAGARCVLELLDGTTGDPIPGINTCTNSCDPVDQTGCASGLRCIAASMDTGGDITDCSPPGNRLTNQTCGSTDDCVGGDICVDTGASTLCLEYCEVGIDTCAGTATCIGFVDPLLIAGTEYGACN
jgi:large repetitive protein